MTEGAPPLISLVLADDHPRFLAAVREVLAADPRMRVLLEARDGVTALSAIRRLQPQVAVLDLEMPGLDGLAVARAVGESGRPTAIVLLTMHKAEHVFRSALHRGIRHYVLKEDFDSHLIPAIHAALAKQPYFSPKLRTAAMADTLASLP